MPCVGKLVKSYFRIGLSLVDRVCGVVISRRTLTRWCRQLHLVRRIKHTNLEELVDAVWGIDCVHWLYFNSQIRV